MKTDDNILNFSAVISWKINRVHFYRSDALPQGQ